MRLTPRLGDIHIGSVWLDKMLLPLFFRLLINFVFVFDSKQSIAMIMSQLHAISIRLISIMNKAAESFITTRRGLCFFFPQNCRGNYGRERPVKVKETMGNNLGEKENES